MTPSFQSFPLFVQHVLFSCALRLFPPKGSIPGELRQLKALRNAIFDQNNFSGEPSVAGVRAVNYLAFSVSVQCHSATTDFCTGFRKNNSTRSHGPSCGACFDSASSTASSPAYQSGEVTGVGRQQRARNGARCGCKAIPRDFERGRPDFFV